MKQIIDKLSQVTSYSTKSYVGDIDIIDLGNEEEKEEE